VLKVTTGTGGATHKRVVDGDQFDVPIVQPPYQDVIASGHIDPSTETPLATIPVVVLVRRSDPRPDISTPDAVRRLLLAARGVSYPDPAGGLGGGAGMSVEATARKLGILDQMQPKVKRVQGVGLLQLLARGDIDVALTFPSEISEPAVQVVGPLPLEISTPTGLVGFVSRETKAPGAARAVLSYFSSAEAVSAYEACGMRPGR
jgi:molybdate transport system substrate-binding protein